MRTEQPARPGARPDQRRRSFNGERPQGDLLYGRNAVLEALAGKRRHQRLMIAEGVKPDERLARIERAGTSRGVPVERVARSVLDERTQGANHQGVALQTSGYPYASLSEITAGTGNVLVLDHVQDPQNLGTLLRAAEAAAVAGIVIPKDRAVQVTPAVVNASAGAVEHVRLAQAPNLARTLEALKSTGRWVLGLEGSPAAVDLFSADLPLPAALVIGSEGSGLSPLVRKQCDLLVAIPMGGRVQSLNAATAGSIALFELLRRSRMV